MGSVCSCIGCVFSSDGVVYAVYAVIVDTPNNSIIIHRWDICVGS